MINDAPIIDAARSVCLRDGGAPEYLAVTAVANDGSEHLVLAQRDSINDDTAVYDATCCDVAHEQLGPLPIEYVRRFTISRRAHRCGRRTQAGRPCRIRVAAAGDACEWHRAKAAQ
ncbi:hypothetical protein KXD97_10025 [Mycobacterium sp. SMC-8]|uniref:hypothetical protein n=1 Tax=Mycobacterium sp. SMC-8 TaxID=2857060 RepID=UPI0021B23598|nr:hypothetical protein [Mycobacterium sp. SMC-8]UXA14079.1 hypothetical protein KXD97_10025 [Mycobacterium sp. SMC-8]